MYLFQVCYQFTFNYKNIFSPLFKFTEHELNRRNNGMNLIFSFVCAFASFDEMWIPFCFAMCK